MKTRIPPVLQFFVCGAIGWALAALLPANKIDWPILHFTGLALTAMGVLLLTLAIVAFVQARTTVDPLEPERAAVLVTTGLYGISRNPMYLAMLLILIGGAFLLGNIASLFAPVLFVLSITVLQLKPEERALQTLFGDAYESYRRRIRRWI